MHALFRGFTTMATKARSYEESIQLLNTCQSNAATIEAVRKAGNALNKISIPEIKEYIHRVGLDLDTLNSSLNVIHIAGTKGKGSTSALMESVLRTHRLRETDSHAKTRPLKTGLFTSPHLIEVRERIRIDGKPISAEQFSEAFSRVWDSFEETETKPGYFRFILLMSLHVFAKEKVDVAIMETGVGGEYDSTNVFPAPYVTTITSLGLDHQSLLGQTIDEIAWHKGGIMKPGVPCITSPQPASAMQILRNRSIERDIAPAKTIPPTSTQYQLIEIDDKDISALRDTPLGLKGDHQYINAAVAVASCSEWVSAYNARHGDWKVEYEAEDVKRGLGSAMWPGRSQTLTFPEFPNATFHIDGAHTPESLEVCATWFNTIHPIYPAERNILLFYCTGGRSPDDLLRPLMRVAQPFTHVIFCSIETKVHNPSHTNHTVFKDTEMKAQRANAASWERVARGGVHAGAEVIVFGGLDDALAVVGQGNGVRTNVFVTGSMYLVGTVLTYFKVDVV
ncbi:Mur ligase [Chytriomyces sp. MP71]|nr:Mur ligase [Chytriomyces sp. MP71]